MRAIVKIYIDISVPSAYFDDEKPERAELTKEFWSKSENYKLYVPTLVEDELKQVKDRKRYITRMKGIKS